MAIYGEMLLSFPEQFRSFTYFDMPALINDSYGTRTNISTIQGVVQNAGTDIKDSNGNIVKTDEMNIWTMANLIHGRFIEFNSIVYRIIPGNDWPTEGGFYSYTIKKLVGSNGTSTDTQAWALPGTPI